MIPVITAGIEAQQENFDYLMDELAELAKANSMSVVADVRQRLQKPVSATYLGKGKIAEIAEIARETNAQFLILNDELSPTQIRNLEKDAAISVLDRTELILEIFSNRAHSKEAQIQVEIARLKYKMPRLRVAPDIKLDQQSASGALANRGAGETKLELNKRTLQKRISFLSHELKEIDKEFEIKSKSRRNSDLPSVALVGYTNAGKSTTMNGLLSLFSEDEKKQVFEKDMLFATLDTSVRSLSFSDNKKFLLSDTVGFVSKLPHNLIEAFKSTLAEVRDADLLIQVIDVSDPHLKEMISTTNKTLEELEIGHKTMIYAYNKADKISLEFPTVEGLNLTYSARDESSLQELASLIKKSLFPGYQKMKFLIPFTSGAYLESLNSKANVLKTEYTAKGSIVTAEVSPIQAKYYSKFSWNPDENKTSAEEI
ncbi:GTPase HflX [Liquorilactobacillus cacaonum]|uniref:GTPase HflX n=1 Tax=Liquorilactobacillus cacaonum DSM 21116 TaxID=1423729 RepID=A0A0R2CDX3_9LACO|nr:GTPase HflX [Liquorilactobacillus cacaonum]KRM89949.1 GTP-binding protein [Liquorilactobacillus cacaonum DSM 21116]